ncbi:MAG: IS3 family transposase [Clostridia bacterium]
MAGQRYSDPFKEQALALAARQDKPASVVARELGIPRKTLYKWMEAARQHPTQPFVGSGHLRADDHRVRDLERQVRDLQEENAILKKRDAHLRQRPEVRFRFIKNHRFTFSVTKMCQVLQVSRSGYYAWVRRPPSAAAQRRRQRLERIRAIWATTHGRYGSPKIAAQLRREGERISGKTVARLMHAAGIRARVVRRYKATTSSRHTYPVADNVLARQFTATQPHAVWMADITYIATDEGWLYLATLEDLATRQIVGWALEPSMTQALTLAALDRAVARHRPPSGVLHHSDRGSQYAAHAYQARLARYGMTSSMSRKGNGWDNACIESWHSVLKKELVYLSHFRTRAEATAAIFEYIEIFYNRQRLHSAVGYCTPAEAAQTTRSA